MPTNRTDTPIRHTRARPCQVCYGFDEAPRGKDQRCHGFTSGEYAHCAREEYAGTLPRNSKAQTYAHRLTGKCGCGAS